MLVTLSAIKDEVLHEVSKSDITCSRLGSVDLPVVKQLQDSPDFISTILVSSTQHLLNNRHGLEMQKW